MRSAAVVLVLCALLGGCVANGPAFTPASKDAEKAIVYFYRLPGTAFGGQKARVFLNGSHTVDLRQGGYSWVSLTPGTYEVSQDWWGGGPDAIKHQLELRAGDEAYFRLYTGGCQGGLNDICLGWTFERIDSNHAAEEIQSMKFEQLLPPVSAAASPEPVR
jgi:hypothetical protein